MILSDAPSQNEWDAFLLSQTFRPFLQSWTMGEVYRDIGQEPIRLMVKEGEEVIGICQAIFVPARRGRHLAIHYGPVVKKNEALAPLTAELSRIAVERGCSFIRVSPFTPVVEEEKWKQASDVKAVPSPLHLLGEHIWYLPLVNQDPWHNGTHPAPAAEVHEPPLRGGDHSKRTDEEILMSMRKTTRNLIRRAEKEGVTVRASTDPINELDLFLKLHNETRSRHGFTPYRDNFFRAQVAHFAPRKECTLYLAEHQGEVLAASIHMHTGGETSYHHGASTMSKIPASYLLQWTAIKDALKRGDHVYSFWGIAPVVAEEDPEGKTKNYKLITSRHPFAGVTLFKTGFGGNLLNLMHCVDIPLSKTYQLTRAFEFLRKWKRGF